jgi:hypothetical protein
MGVGKSGTPRPPGLWTGAGAATAPTSQPGGRSRAARSSAPDDGANRRTRRAAATTCRWCGGPITPRGRGPITTWCPATCRHRAWQQARAGAPRPVVRGASARQAGRGSRFPPRPLAATGRGCWVSSPDGWTTGECTTATCPSWRRRCSRLVETYPETLTGARAELEALERLQSGRGRRSHLQLPATTPGHGDGCRTGDRRQAPPPPSSGRHRAYSGGRSGACRHGRFRPARARRLPGADATPRMGDRRVSGHGHASNCCAPAPSSPPAIADRRANDAAREPTLAQSARSRPSHRPQDQATHLVHPGRAEFVVTGS